MAATQVGSRPQISTDRPPSAHLSLFDTNCTLSGSGRPTAFSLLCTKSALTVGHQRSEEASYLTRHTRVRLDVIKDKNVIFKHCFYFIFFTPPLSTCHPSRTSSCSPKLQSCSPLHHFGGTNSGGGSQYLTVAKEFSFQNKRPWTSLNIRLTCFFHVVVTAVGLMQKITFCSDATPLVTYSAINRPVALLIHPNSFHP